MPPGHANTPISIVALDEYAGLRRPISFIKIDVEGAEPLAFAGAARLLAEDRPTILSEIHPRQLARVAGVTPAAFIQQLVRLGYRCHLLNADQPGAEIDDAPHDGVASIVFVPA